MGGAQSSDSLKDNPQLRLLASDVPVDAELDKDPYFWNKMLDIHLTVEEVCVDATHTIESTIEALAQGLERHNSKTKNFSIFVRRVISLVESFSPQEEQNPKAVERVLHALFLLRIFTRYFVHRTTGTQLLHQFQSGADSREALHLLRVLMEFSVRNPVVEATYAVHAEVMNVLLVLFSTQMFVGLGEGAFFLDVLMGSNASTAEKTRAKNFVGILMSHYLEQKEPPYAATSSTYSMLQRIGTAASKIFFFPWSAYSYFFSKVDSNETEPQNIKLADKSLLVLLVLVHHTDQHNPFRTALSCLRDAQFTSASEEKSAVDQPIQVSLSFLYNTLVERLSDDRTILLLYYLLHENNQFLSYVLACTEIDGLLVPMLQLLYQSVERKPQQIYMNLIILLILSHDEPFNKNLQERKVASVPWFKESVLSNISLGSLAMVVLVRTVLVNLSKLRDVYLHSNCLATLANMASSISEIHPYAANRLVTLFRMLSKKYTRIIEKGTEVQIVTQGSESKQEISSRDPISQEAEGATLTEGGADFFSHVYESSELTTYSDFLHMVLKIINSIITHALHRNPDLVYSLLYQQEIFNVFQNNPRFSGLISNIQKVIHFFNESLEQEKLQEMTPEAIIQVVQRKCISWRSELLTPFVELKFTYEEEENAEAFFTPYVWAVVTHYSGLHWDPQYIKIFSWAQMTDQLEELPTEKRGDAIETV